MKTKFYIGLDVHEKSTDYFVRDIDGNRVIEGTSASKPRDLRSILGPYLPLSIIGLECNTEIYPIYSDFVKDCQIYVGNTVQLRTLIGKNDRLDAKRLSDMLRLGIFPTAYIPDEDIRSLRSLVSIRHGIMQESVRVQNRIKALVRKYGIRMPKGGIGVRYIEMTRQYLAANPDKRDLRHAVDHYVSVSQRLSEVTNEIIGFAKSKFPQQFEAIVKHRGIGEILAVYYISEICPINRFKSEKKLRRYAGIIPCASESAGKTYSAYLPKTTSRSRLRWALIEGAQCMVRYDDNIKAYYKRKKKQKKIRNKAIVAVATSISDKIYKTLMSCQAN